MRFRLPSVAFVALALPLAGMAVLSACGSSTDDTLADAGNDATLDVAKDVTPDVAPDVVQDAGCMNDVNLVALLPAADAAIDADAGGIPLGVCLGCFETKCSGQITNCNNDCSCRQGILDLVTCVGMTGDFMTCGENALVSGDTQQTLLLSCAYSNCLSACIGGDGGLPGDASLPDSSKDAADGG